jgi:hypothetical protein
MWVTQPTWRVIRDLVVQSRGLKVCNSLKTCGTSLADPAHEVAGLGYGRSWQVPTANDHRDVFGGSDGPDEPYARLKSLGVEYKGGPTDAGHVEAHGPWLFRFLSDPDVPAIFQEGGLQGRPEMAELAREHDA